MDRNIFYKCVVLLIFLFALISCASTINGKTKPEDIAVVDRTSVVSVEKDKNLISYGADSEVRLYITNNIKYYMLPTTKSLEEMNQKELRYNSIDTSIIKINHTNMSSRDGITLTYYDIRIFLSEKDKDGNTIVGIFEPSRQAWIFGEDINRANHSIEIRDGKNMLGPVKIELRSMSRLYR